MTRAQRHAVTPRPGTPGVEWEYERVTLPAECSRSAATELLADRAERGGWTLHRVRLSRDGTRRVVLRRKIIRQRVSVA